MDYTPCTIGGAGDIRDGPKFDRMFGLATCDYSTELRQKFGVICGFVLHFALAGDVNLKSLYLRLVTS